jgi:hypothetical protein
MNNQPKRLYKENIDINKPNKKTLKQQFNDIEAIMKKMKESIGQDKKIGKNEN